MSDNLSFLLTCAAECLNNWGYDGHGKHVDDGVKEITRLRAENEKLREALVEEGQSSEKENRRKRIYYNEVIAAEKVIAELRVENETLRRDVRTAVMGDSAELANVKRENEKLRGLLREAHVKMVENDLWVNLRKRVAAAIRESGE